MDAETKFTPGPWDYRVTPRPNNNGFSWREIVGGGDREGNPLVLGELYTGLDHDEVEDCVAEANARLIAAAPELYEGAVRALNYIENTEGELGIKLDTGVFLRAAIAKARGAA